MASNPRRLGYGEFEPELRPSDPEHWISRYTACLRFLEAAGALYPDVVTDLSRFPRELTSELQREGVAIEWLRAWARRYRLESDLALAVAAWTVTEWAYEPGAFEERRWSIDRVGWHAPETKLQPVLPDPFAEDRAMWMERCGVLWSDRVRELEAAGCSRSKLKDPAHFEWLARFVIGEESYEHIRSQAGVDSVQVIADAVHRLAEMIDLKLPRRGGPPRKSIKK